MQPPALPEHLSQICTKEITLIDLPNELLLDVMDDLHPSDLLNLSLLCGRLHRLALPAYLMRYGIAPIDHHLTLSAEQLEALPGLRLAPFIKDIRGLSCNMKPPSSADGIVTVVHQLCRLLFETDGLEDVTLNFDHCHMTYFECYFLGRAKEEAWIRLLTAAARRCTSLALRHKNISTGVFYADLIKQEEDKWQSRGLDRCTVDELRKLLMNRGPHAHGAEQMPYTLKSLVLHMNAFLFRSYSDWSFHILNTAPLTRLEFIGVEVPDLTSAILFRGIHIPTLEHLCITACSFSFRHFAHFLYRHSSISTLRIVDYIVPHPLSTPTLPHLVALHSSPDNITRLLTPTAAFPKLTRICVVVRVQAGDRFNISTVEHSLTPVADRLKNIDIHLDILLHPAANSRVDLEDANDVEKYPVLGRISRVAFGVSSLCTEDTEAIPTWLSVFPLLEHIEFLSVPNGPDHDGKMALLRRIVQACGQIRSVKIGEETHEVSAWLYPDS